MIKLILKKSNKYNCKIKFNIKKNKNLIHNIDINNTVHIKEHNSLENIFNLQLLESCISAE